LTSWRSQVQILYHPPYSVFLKGAPVAAEIRVNERITVQSVRLVKEDGEAVGVVDIATALEEAKKASRDLVEVSPQSNPPVCKLMDYGKYKFDQKSKRKQSKKTTGGMKEIRLRLKTDDGDFMIKANRGRRFLKEGNRLQLSLTLHGREMTRKEMAVQIVNRLALELSDASKIEREAKFEGRRVIVVLAPKKA
jgi:translation initiation factor IF-3